MSEQINIQSLVDWLEGHPGEPPPGELDPDIVEAVYVLRPDLAPAHRVKLEDILSRIETGPIAKHTLEESIEESIEESVEQSVEQSVEESREQTDEYSSFIALDTDELKYFETEDVPTEIAVLHDYKELDSKGKPDNLSFLRRNRSSIWTGAATISMAALVLFVVLPMDSRNAMRGGGLSEVAVPRTAETPSSIFDEDFPSPTARDIGPPSRARVESAELARSRPSPSTASAPPLGSPDVDAAGSLDWMDREEPLRQLAAEPPTGIGQLARESGKPASGLSSVDGSGEASSSLGRGLGSRGLGSRGFGRGGANYGEGSGGATVGGASQGAGSIAARTEIDFEGVESFEELDVEEEQSAASAFDLGPPRAAPATGKTRRLDRSRQSNRKISDLSESAGAAEEADAAAYSPRTDAEFVDAEAPEEDAGTAGLEDARRLSRVTDYNPNWFVGTLSEDEVKMIQEGIGKDASSGRPKELSAMIGYTDYRVGQDMAFRAATMAHARGSRTTALTLIQQGKARSSANTVFLSLLYNLEGEIHLARGDLSAAEQAFRTSAGLNQARTR